MKRLIIIGFIFCTFIATGTIFAQSKIFTDVSDNDWFYEYVKVMKDQNIISGHPDGSFHPSDNVNRAELSKILSGYSNKFVYQNEYSQKISELKSEINYLKGLIVSKTNNENEFKEVVDDNEPITDPNAVWEGKRGTKLSAYGVIFEQVSYRVDPDVNQKYQSDGDKIAHAFNFRITNTNNTQIKTNKSLIRIIQNSETILSQDLGTAGSFSSDFYVAPGETKEFKLYFWIKGGSNFATEACIFKERCFVLNKD